MILLDTDHLTVHAFSKSQESAALVGRIRASTEDFGTTIVCVEEILRGWLAAIRRKPDVHGQIPAYLALAKIWNFFRDWPILQFDETAADIFKTHRKHKVRIGSQDLKIASIALAHDALLLSANLRDFRQVPNLRVENWLAP